MQSNMTKELQRGLEAMQVLSAWHFQEILNSQITLHRPDLISALCLPAPVRSWHSWGRAFLDFFFHAPQEVSFGRWGVADNGAHGPCHLQVHMVYVPQKDCMLVRLDDRDTASSAHMGFSSHNANSGKERGHSLLCSQPSWTWSGWREFGSHLWIHLAPGRGVLGWIPKERVPPAELPPVIPSASISLEIRWPNLTLLRLMRSSELIA